MVSVQNILESIKFDFLYLDITAACNLQCRHCLFAITPTHLTEEQLTQDELRNVIDNAVLYGIRKILLSGKEIFLFPEKTFELLEYLSKIKEDRQMRARDDIFQFGFITNGTLVKPEHIERIPQNIGWIDVSLEGSQEYHERVRGRGTFEKTLKTIEGFVAAGLPVSLAFTATSLNDEGIVAGIEEFFARGVRTFFISHYVPRELNDPLCLSNTRLLKLIEGLRRVSEICAGKQHEGEIARRNRPHDACSARDVVGRLVGTGGSARILCELEAPQAVFLMEQGLFGEQDILIHEGRPHEFFVHVGDGLAIKWQRVYHFFLHDIRVSPDGWVITCEEENNKSSYYSRRMNREWSINIRDCEYNFYRLEERIKTEKKMFSRYLEGIENHECRTMPCFEYCYGGNQYARFVIEEQWSKQSLNCEKTLVGAQRPY